MTPDWLERAYREGRVLSDTGPARLPGPEAPPAGGNHGRVEAAFQDAVAEYAQSRGWKVFHGSKGRTAKGWRTPVRYDGKGFVDLVMVRVTGGPPRVIFAELKSDTGTLSPEQRDWGAWLRAAGAEYHVWRPKDMGEVRRVLG